MDGFGSPFGSKWVLLHPGYCSTELERLLVCKSGACSNVLLILLGLLYGAEMGMGDVPGSIL